ncbi:MULTISPECIES: IS110 family transposase [unclassified Gordonia (in: high G+C Gram-positive bacteria)]|uniref:IS110 family transposase n=1 Tax=unclassified Gordonia (in: high G+C Gram-positive bacteria) TaxID=2657482 RepID=UPI00071C8D55|nr:MULTISPECIES: IS110 family transposase [unclassified Gordonia (in: high G+C Gram-positive bacteria)]KSU52537.1 transposase [Gordonia sp. SGD-V-85]MCX2755256.1 IS110 family transposase [Gordonia sp. 4N]SCC58165.1 Transposase IS116/IS110/IS902 family protein [Gordonia sp. v-85]
MIFVGNDWASDHHDVCVMDEHGTTLAARRLPENAAGVTAMHELIARFAHDPTEVVIGIETDHGMWVAALVAAGYQVFAINPLSVSRYRDRHHVGGTKSDKADAKTLADLVRTDRHNHRLVAADTVAAEAITVMARTHQNLVWARSAQQNVLRAQLGAYYPAAVDAFGDDLAHKDCLAVLRRAPTPRQGAALTVAAIRSALKKGGRQRNIDHRAREIQQALRGGGHLNAPEALTAAYAATVTATVGMLAALTTQIDQLETTMAQSFRAHPDAEIYLSMPGVGDITGARMLGEFGDDPERYATAKSRRNYAGTSPRTIASGKGHVVLARHIRNTRLNAAAMCMAQGALTGSPGARAYYDSLKDQKKSHTQALRAVANRLVGILHGCLAHRTLYNEHTAWGHRTHLAA